MPGSLPSSIILAAAGQGAPPGGGPLSSHGRGGGKGTTSLSRRSFCGLVPPKYSTGGVQHSSVGTSQTQTQQTGIYYETS